MTDSDSCRQLQRPFEDGATNVRYRPLTATAGQANFRYDEMMFNPAFKAFDHGT